MRTRPRRAALLGQHDQRFRERRSNANFSAIYREVNSGGPTRACDAGVRSYRGIAPVEVDALVNIVHGNISS